MLFHRPACAAILRVFVRRLECLDVSILLCVCRLLFFTASASLVSLSCTSCRFLLRARLQGLSCTCASSCFPNLPPPLSVILLYLCTLARTCSVAASSSHLFLFSASLCSSAHAPLKPSPPALFALVSPPLWSGALLLLLRPGSLSVLCLARAHVLDLERASRLQPPSPAYSSVTPQRRLT
jgi:hypothetical protein